MSQRDCRTCRKATHVCTGRGQYIAPVNVPTAVEPDGSAPHAESTGRESERSSPEVLGQGLRGGRMTLVYGRPTCWSAAPAALLGRPRCAALGVMQSGTASSYSARGSLCKRPTTGS
jgi:hypothetical protein